MKSDLHKFTKIRKIKAYELYNNTMFMVYLVDVSIFITFINC
jgi:hypothetical protein